MVDRKTRDSTLDNPLSILTALEEGPRAGSRRPWRSNAAWWCTIAALLLVVAAAAFSGWRVHSADKRPQLSLVETTTIANPVVPPTKSQLPEATQPAETVIRQVAAVEEIAAPTAASDGASLASASALSANPLAGLPTVKPAPAAADPVSARASKATNGSIKAAAPKQDAGKEARRPEPRRTAGSAEAKPKTNTSATEDADVDLIAALMQHMNRQSAAEGGHRETIADLVAQCKSLNGPEAQQCQRRICDNYWGRADACPRSLAPGKKSAAKSSP